MNGNLDGHGTAIRGNTALAAILEPSRIDGRVALAQGLALAVCTPTHWHRIMVRHHPVTRFPVRVSTEVMA